MKRKARKEPLEHKQIDRMVPLNFEDLGTINDPCFGKHFSIKAQECGRCGDSEICQIACANKLLLEVSTESTKARFKDVEEGELIDGQNKEFGLKMAKRALQRIGHQCSLAKMVLIAQEKWNLTDKDRPIILQRLIKAANDTKKLKVNKKQTKYQLK